MSERSLLDRVQRLEDIEAIRQMVARYAHGADRCNDPEILGPLFAEDAVWEAGDFGHYRGRAAIAPGLADIARRTIRWSLHYMVSPWIEVADDGVHARCHWYLWELARVAADSTAAPQAHWIGGWYESTLVKQPEGWRFQHVHLHTKLLHALEADWQTPG